ncbi:MAG: aminotransferase class III-fold pyridoxal phosphate-dependent enzyme [Desulfobacterales bacterium]
MNSQQYIQLEETFGAHNYNPLDVVLSRGRGIWVWDVEENKYMDCLSAYSAVNQGHCHPKIMAAITPHTVGVLLEPIQGEAGVIIPPSGYLKDVKAICEKNDIVLILDEIQTGLGRTGKLLAEEHEGIEADVTVIGKALSGGFYPISAVLSNKEVLGVFMPGDHGSTFGGNPLACAVARTALKVLIQENMIENAQKMGDYFLSQLKNIDSPFIKEIRGKGLLIGVELLPEAGGARGFCERLRTKGLLCKETHENVIRFAPPLVITKAQIDWAMERIESVLKER